MKKTPTENQYIDVVKDNHNIICLHITHRDISDYKSELGFLELKWSWKEAPRRSFDWEITRPVEGSEKFNKNCPFCDERFEVEVDSLEKLASERRGHPVMKIISMFLFVASIIAIVLGFQFHFPLIAMVFCFLAAPFSLGLFFILGMGHHGTNEGLNTPLNLPREMGLTDTHNLDHFTTRKA